MADAGCIGGGEDEPGRKSEIGTTDRRSCEVLADSASRRRITGRTSATGESEGGEPRAASSRLHWEGSVWLPCADGKVRRAPTDAFLLADGVSGDVLAELAETHRSALGALGNSIVPQVAFEVIRAILMADMESES